MLCCTLHDHAACTSTVILFSVTMLLRVAYWSKMLVRERAMLCCIYCLVMRVSMLCSITLNQISTEHNAESRLNAPMLNERYCETLSSISVLKLISKASTLIFKKITKETLLPV
jgi:hypothetical protein